MARESSAIIVVDLAFGDCGKGTIVDFLTRRCEAYTIVRFNGGPQAGHNVVTGDGRHHTFSQFGSGSFVPGVRTLLSRFMLIEPYALFNEAEHLRRIGMGDVLSRLMVDGRCPVITPAHQAANRLRELARGEAAHGTCGMGVGEAVQDLMECRELVILAAELADRVVVARKLRAIRDRKMDQLRDAVVLLGRHPRAMLSVQTLMDPSWIEVAVDNFAELARQATIADELAVRAAVAQAGCVIFEGAQGVLLDESFGFHPHTTWSTTTFANADTVLDEAGYRGKRTRIGVLRSYFSRHGVGPLVTEDDGLRERLPEPHNSDACWQGHFRVGLFDAILARYALSVAGPVDGLAITHMDRLPLLPRQVCTAYEDDGANEDCFVRHNRRIIDIRVSKSARVAQREHLTRAIDRCKPVYDAIPDGAVETWRQIVEKELRQRIVITSSGPLAEDKRVVADVDGL